MKKLASLIAVIFFSNGTPAQVPPAQSLPRMKPLVEIANIAPRPEDVASIDGLLTAFYAAVNVAPDATRQWDRDRTLYSPWLRFVGLYQKGRFVVYNHQELVDSSEPMVQRGFSEREIHRTVRRYGQMAHVDSTYEGWTGTVERTRFRGINSLELYFDGKRWWIASVLWQAETPEQPIPAAFLPVMSGAD